METNWGLGVGDGSAAHERKESCNSKTLRQNRQGFSLSPKLISIKEGREQGRSHLSCPHLSATFSYSISRLSLCFSLIAPPFLS